MLPGLTIRKTFIVLDLALAGAIIAVAGGIAHKLTEVAANPLAEAAERDAFEVAAVDPILHDVGGRNLYDSIVDAKLFGKAGAKQGDKSNTARPPEPPTPPPPPPPDLRLVLHGTAATDPKDPLASAIIENKTAGRGETKIFFLGDAIQDGVFLEEVHPREVYISNKGELQVLKMEEGASAGDLIASRPAAPPAPRSNIAQQTAPDRFTLNKNEFVQQLYVNYSDLVTKVRPELVYDDDGNVAGITASNISDIPLAETLDFRDGDVLQRINNERIDSQETIIKLINKYRNMNTFRVTIMRDGNPVVRTYNLQ